MLIFIHTSYLYTNFVAVAVRNGYDIFIVPNFVDALVLTDQHYFGSVVKRLNSFISNKFLMKSYRSIYKNGFLVQI